MDDEFKTYKEWNQQGFRIHKGEKATKFRDGEPLFNCTQVYKPTNNDYDDNWLRVSTHLGITGPWDDPPH